MEILQYFKELGVEAKVRKNIASSFQYPDEINLSNLEKKWKNIFIPKSSDDLRTVMAELRTIPNLVIDTETTGLDCHTAELLGVGVLGFNDSTTKLYFIPFHHPLVSISYSIEHAAQWLNKLLEKRFLIAHNVQYDLMILKCNGVYVPPDRWFDTAIAYRIARNGMYKKFGLKVIAQREFNVQPWDMDLEKRPLSMVGIKDVAVYCGQDLVFTYLLFNKIEREFFNDFRLLWEEVERPVIEICGEIAHGGIKVNVEYLNDLKTRIESFLIPLKQKINDHITTYYPRYYRLLKTKRCRWKTDFIFNPGSDKDIRELLFNIMGIPEPEELKYRTETGLVKVGYRTIEKLLEYDKNGVIKYLLWYKKLTSIEHCYKMYYDDSTGRLKNNIIQPGQQGGRISMISQSPPKGFDKKKFSLNTVPSNLQNLVELFPTILNPDDSVRRILIPDEGCIWVKTDYKQEEYVIASYLSEEDKIIEKLENEVGGDTDFHTTIMKEIFGDNASRNLYRPITKAICYGMMYGRGVQSTCIEGVGKIAFFSADEYNSLISNFSDVQINELELVKCYDENSNKYYFLDSVINNKKYRNLLGNEVIDLILINADYDYEYTANLYDKISIPFEKLTNYVIREASEIVEEDGVIYNILGRKLMTARATSAMNFRIQSAASEVMRIALRKSWELIQHNYVGTKILVILHDELDFSVPEKYASDFIRDIKLTMEDEVCNEFNRLISEMGVVLKYPVKLRISISAGASWGELEELN